MGDSMTAFRFRAGARSFPSVVVLWGAVALLASSQDARASHHRGVDDWADISANGVVTLRATTRWTQGTVAASGVDASRFGMSVFPCDATGEPITVSPPVGMRLVRVSDGSTAYEWPANSFTLSSTTTTIDTSSPAYDARLQVLVIPLGSTPDPGQIAAPLNLAPGDYEIRWNDWSRVRGIQNLDPTDECGSGFGFNVRIRWNGTANHGPALAAVNTIVGRSAPYNQNVNATDPDGEPLSYAFAPLNPLYPDFGPQTLVPGLALDGLTGQLTIPASTTAGLLDNSFAEPAADYLVKVLISDTSGAVTQREMLLDVVPTSGEAAGDGSLTAGPAFGSFVQISWTPACNATDHTVYWGTGPAAGAPNWTGAACALGTIGSASFNPGTPPAGKFIYFVVVGRTGFNEGSYGRSSAGLERPEAVGVGACDIPQTLNVACSP